MPRGDNFRRGPKRDADTAKIRERSNRRIRGLPPKLEHELEPEPVEIGPSKLERDRASAAMRVARSFVWQVPVLNAEGELVARELPADHILPWESVEDVMREKPSYDDWEIVLTPAGPALACPGRLPMLIDPDEWPDDLSLPVNGVMAGIPIVVDETTTLIR